MDKIPALGAELIHVLLDSIREHVAMGIVRRAVGTREAERDVKTALDRNGPRLSLRRQLSPHPPDPSQTNRTITVGARRRYWLRSSCCISKLISPYKKRHDASCPSDANQVAIVPLVVAATFGRTLLRSVETPRGALPPRPSTGALESTDSHSNL